MLNSLQFLKLLSWNCRSTRSWSATKKICTMPPNSIPGKSEWKSRPGVRSFSYASDSWKQLWKWFLATCRTGAGSASELDLKDQSEEAARVRQRAAECRPQSFSQASYESEKNRRIREIWKIIFTCFSHHAAWRMQLSRESAMEAYESSIRRKHILAEHQREDWATKGIKPSKCHGPQHLIYIYIIHIYDCLYTYTHAHTP